LERWLGRAPTGSNVWREWTAEACGGLERLRSRWKEISESRQAYVEHLTDSELAKDLTFVRLNGDEGTLPLVHQMQHVVNHATLHRGQVVGMIRQLGVVPPATDLLFYLLSPPK
jgi:uncharacterized damage-inducible protein DinB